MILEKLNKKVPSSVLICDLHMCVQIHVSPWTCRDQNSSLDEWPSIVTPFILLHLFTYFDTMSPYENWDLRIWLDWSASESQRSNRLHIFPVGTADMHCNIWYCRWILAVELGSSCLWGKHFTHWAITWAPNSSRGCKDYRFIWRHVLKSDTALTQSRPRIFGYFSLILMRGTNVHECTL